jgi:enoyl-CoA hydratase
MENSPLPVIAAVQGYCLAGGMELMMSADIVFAAADARIGCQHAQYGLVPGWGGSQRLPRLVGLRRAMELMFSARWLDAVTAADWGLVNTVVDAPELLDAANAFAQKLSTRNPEGIGAMKRLAREGAPLPIQAALELEQSIAVPALLSDNVAEGLRAFRDRRDPQFSE